MPNLEQELHDASQAKGRWRKISEERREAARATLEKAEKIKDHLIELRGQLEDVRKKLEDPKLDSEKREELEVRREALADKIEAAVAYRERLYERWQDRVSRLEHAKQQFRHFRKRVRNLRRRITRSESYMSENFVVEEFNCRDGTPVPKAAYPALKNWCQNYGEVLRRKHGTVHINSGFRTRSYNAAIGGASNSVHIYDEHPNAVAVDTTCGSGTPSMWAQTLEPIADGLGRYSTFVHSDNRNRIGWADSRWSG